MTLQDVIAKLGAKKSGRSWMARCPAHDDHDASLSIRESEGRLLMYCHGGCSFEQVVTALNGSAVKAMSPDKPRPGRIIDTYDYTDEGGNLVFQVVRYDPKSFRQRRPDGNGGWIWNLQGIERVLYNLPELVARPLDLVWIVEGEKDANTLRHLGLLATTSSGGAGKWFPYYANSLADRDVAVIPDKDWQGMAHARTIMRSLYGIAASARLIVIPGLPPKADVTWALANGWTAQKLLQLYEEAA